jgi:hypothetical protein
MSKKYSVFLKAHQFFLLLFVVMGSVALAQDDLDVNEMRRRAQQAQANPQQLKYQITDVQEKDGLFTIKYDLNDSNEYEYSVNLILFRENNPKFFFKPITLSGDIGQGKFSGSGRQIIWDSRQDLKQALVGNDFYFVLNITKIEPSHFPWTWVGIGGGVAAGAAILILSHKSSSEPGSSELPAISVSRPN